MANSSRTSTPSPCWYMYSASCMPSMRMMAAFGTDLANSMASLVNFEVVMKTPFVERFPSSAPAKA